MGHARQTNTYRLDLILVQLIDGNLLCRHACDFSRFAVLQQHELTQRAGVYVINSTQQRRAQG